MSDDGPRISTWTPLDLNLEWSLDPADVDMVTTPGSMTVADGASNGYTVVGATYPAASTFPGSTAPSLLFDGVNDHLDGSKIGLPATVGEIYTFVYFAYFTAAGNTFVADLNTNAGTSGIAFDQGLDGVGPSIRKKGVTSDGTTVQKLNVPIYVEHMFRVNSGATTPSTTRINGVLTASAVPNGNVNTPTGTSFGIGWFSSGSTFFMKGHLGRIFLARGALTVPQRAELAGFASRIYSIV